MPSPSNNDPELSAPVPILVDAYNVLGVWRGLYHQRRYPTFPKPPMLIQLLEKYSREFSLDVTLVFDGRRRGTQVKGEKITVIYTEPGEEADDYLIWLAAELGGNCLVVSSDKRVKQGCAKSGAQTMPAGVFLGKLRQSH